MTDATSILSHNIYDVPNIRASLWIVRFRSLFLFSAFVLPRFTVSIAPQIQNRWIHTFSLPVVLRRRSIFALLLLLLTGNALKSFLFSALSYSAAMLRFNPRGRASRIPEVLHIGLGLE